MVVEQNNYERCSKIEKKRLTYRHGNLFVKCYLNSGDCLPEYNVLMELSKNVSTFVYLYVPKPYFVLNDKSSCYIFMERVEGTPLKTIIVKSLLSKGLNIIEGYLNLLSNALRELHSVPNIDVPECYLPKSISEAVKRANRIILKLMELGVLNPRDVELLEKAFNRGLSRNFDCSVHTRIFNTAILHGEFYFTHIIIDKGRNKVVFVDFQKCCLGPVYYDLTMFGISLYVSLTLPYISFSEIIAYERILWSSYFKGLTRELYSLMKLLQLYVALRELYIYHSYSRLSRSRVNRIVAKIKAKKLRKAIESAILPYI